MGTPASRQTQPYVAWTLVALTAISGVAACLFGAIGWGVVGLTLGLAGAWSLFLVGLCGLYQRERQLEQLVIDGPRGGQPALDLDDERASA